MSVREQVIEFHEVFGQPIKDKPGVPDEARVRLRMALIAEEFLEILRAVFPESPTYEQSRFKMTIENAPIDVNLVELADGLADLDYVVEGTRLEFGIAGGPVADEVHRSNMAKATRCITCGGIGQVMVQYGSGQYDFAAEECKSCSGTGYIVKRREDGKVLKPESWSAPDIVGVLRKQGWDG